MRRRRAAMLALSLALLVWLYNHKTNRFRQPDLPEDDDEDVLRPVVSLPPPRPCLQPPNNWTSVRAQMAQEPRWSWISNRIGTSWSHWQRGVMDIGKTYNFTNYSRKKVLVVPGILTTKLASRGSTEGGGPLGDLLMWGDLVGGLQALGHSVTLVSSIRQATNLMTNMLKHNDTGRFDAIFVDLMAMSQFSFRNRKAFRCHFRVLDAYGTEAAYNDPVFSRKHGYNSPWGHQGLHLKQFYTLYPHTPDNSFLGFVIPEEKQKTNTTKEQTAVIYGKAPIYITPAVHWPYLKTFIKHLTVYATMPSTDRLPDGVHNLGVLKASEYKELLQKAKILVGLGNPLESSGALEALSGGCVFINPKFLGERRNVLRSKIYRKPTSRQMSSQVPYLETINPGHVLTVNVHNTTHVERVIQDILRIQVKPLIPHEFSVAGYLERLLLMLDRQEFCPSGGGSAQPSTGVKYLSGRPGQSCNDLCAHELVCEPSQFRFINGAEEIASVTGKRCTISETVPDILAPYVNQTTEACRLQKRSSLYSCAGSSQNVLRICPCAKILKGLVFPVSS